MRSCRIGLLEHTKDGGVYAPFRKIRKGWTKLKRLKRPLALLLVLVMCISLLQITVLADDITRRTGAEGVSGETVGSASAIQDEIEPIAQAPGRELLDDYEGLSVTKTVTTTQPLEGFQIGEKVKYRIVVYNIGLEDIHGLVVRDPLTGQEEKYDRWGNNFLPGASFTVTTSLTISEDNLKEVQDGKLVNVAEVSGYIKEGWNGKAKDVRKTASASIDVAQAALTVEKTVDPTSSFDLGEEIKFDIKVTNSSKVTVNDIAVTDPLTGLHESVGTLAPGESTATFTTYKV